MTAGTSSRRNLAWSGAVSGPAIAFAFGCAWIWTLHVLHGISVFPWDSGVYWDMAVRPESVAKESLARGYLFPVMLRSAVRAGAWIGLDPIGSYRLVSSVVYAAVLALLVPDTYARLANTGVRLGSRLAVVALVPLIFPGLLVYPLSDLPACAFMWLCVWCLMRARQSTGMTAAALALASGAAAAAAYNTRTIYLYPAMLIAIFALWQWRTRPYLMACFALGVAATTIPQVQMNREVHSINSANPTAGRRTSLFVDHLKWGITLQKYETSISKDVPPSVFYADKSGLHLLSKVCRRGSIASVADYAAAVFRHPIDFAAVYGRHLLNGLDVRDGMVYVSSPSTERNFAGLASFTSMLLLLLALKSAPKRVRQRPYMLVLILPALAILPGAMETRFMLPLVLLLVAAGTAEWNSAAIASQLRQHAVAYLVAGGAILACFMLVTQKTQAAVTFTWPTHDCQQ